MCDYEDDKELLELEVCPSCHGAGTYDIGDCEEGVIDNCPECDGQGEININA